MSKIMGIMYLLLIVFFSLWLPHPYRSHFHQVQNPKEESNWQQTNMRTIIQNGSLKIELYYDMLLFEGKLTNTNINLNKVETSLKQGKFTITKKGAILELNIESLVTVVLHHCCSESWVVAGTMNDYKQIIANYPSTHYEYGVLYNGPTVMRVVINYWNHGLRISTINTYPQGDYAKQLIQGRAVWTKGTLDAQSKKGDWYHQYTYANFKPYGSNGNMNINLYVKKI